jgi:hypothetical protein
LELIILFFNFDKNKREFDSLSLPFLLSSSKRPFFKYKGDLYAISSLNSIYHTKILNGQNTVWDSVNIKQLLNDWDNFNPMYQEVEKDIVLSTWSDGDQPYLIIGKSFRNAMNQLFFKVNFVKLNTENLTSVERIQQIEKDNVLLYSFPPYPIPAINLIKSVLYWNSRYDINDAETTVFDLMGTKINSNNIVIDKINKFSAILSWDCSGLNSGIYFIHVFLKGDNITIPIIISK